MTEPPGTMEAAHLSFAILEELISVLIAKDVLTETDRLDLFKTVAGRLDESTRAAAKPSAGVLRQMIEKKGLE